VKGVTRLQWLGDLPATLSTEEAAGLFGCTVHTLWKLARAGTAPVEPLRLGRAVRWPTLAVLHSLGIDPEAGPAPASAEVVPIHRDTAS
jgi:predicted DNA-binding transcriptional regulator AlpA